MGKKSTEPKLPPKTQPKSMEKFIKELEDTVLDTRCPPKTRTLLITMRAYLLTDVTPLNFVRALLQTAGEEMLPD